MGLDHFLGLFSCACTVTTISSELKGARPRKWESLQRFNSLIIPLRLSEKDQDKGFFREKKLLKNKKLKFQFIFFGLLKFLMVFRFCPSTLKGIFLRKVVVYNCGNVTFFFHIYFYKSSSIS